MFQCSPSLPRDCFPTQDKHPDRVNLCFNVLPRYQGIVSWHRLQMPTPDPFQCSPSLPRDCFLRRKSSPSQARCFNVLPRYQGIVSCADSGEIVGFLSFNVLPRYQGIVSRIKPVRWQSMQLLFQCSPSLPRDCFLINRRQSGNRIVSMFSLVTKGLFLSRLQVKAANGKFQCSPSLPRDCFY